MSLQFCVLLPKAGPWILRRSRASQKLTVLKKHCEIVGREYASIYRTSNAFCHIADNDELDLAQLPAERKARIGNKVATALIGSPETIHQRLNAYEEVGVQELMLRFVV